MRNVEYSLFGTLLHEIETSNVHTTITAYVELELHGPSLTLRLAALDSCTFVLYSWNIKA
jgi:hypothetical protein